MDKEWAYEIEMNACVILCTYVHLLDMAVPATEEWIETWGMMFTELKAAIKYS